MTYKQRLHLIDITCRLDGVYNTLYNYEQRYKSKQVRSATDEIGLIQAIVRSMLKKRR